MNGMKGMNGKNGKDSKGNKESKNAKSGRNVAIALKYDTARDAAPLITAVGKGIAADRIVEVAQDSGVAQVEDPFQASALSGFTAGSRVPKFLYDLVAEVLLFVEEADMEHLKRKQACS